MSAQQMYGNLTNLMHQIKDRWSHIADHELTECGRSKDRLMRLLQERAGQTRSQAEDFLDNARQTAASYSSQASDLASQYASQAGDYARNAYDSANVAVRDGYRESRRFVQKRPLEAVGVVLAAGLIVGIAFTALLRSRDA